MPGARPRTRADRAAWRRSAAASTSSPTPHALATYRSDGLAALPPDPARAVLPGTADEVRAVVRACFEAGVPLVARGSGTGLSGGALPVAEGVLIVLARMRRILSIDLDDGAVVVEPGVTNLAISRAVAPTPLLSARPLEPDRLLDRRQRRRELGRRALLQVRLHDQLRDRPRGRAERRHASSSSTATRPATTCSARSSAPRGRSASRRGSRCG